MGEKQGIRWGGVSGNKGAYFKKGQQVQTSQMENQQEKKECAAMSNS